MVQTLQKPFTRIFFFFFFFFFFSSSSFITIPLRSVQAQSLPPSRPDGFVYKNSKADFSDSVVIDAFFDPVCPDSRDSWPPLKQALGYYGSRLLLVVHLLPLPYHDYAFATSRALHIVNGLNTSSTFPLLEQFFKYQEKFYNAQTQNLSKNSVVKEIVEFVASAVGNSYESAIEAGFKDRKTDLKTRVSFKYSTSRGVYGTPTFWVNGFVLPDAGSPLDYTGWRKILDPLVGADEVKGQVSRHVRLML